MTCPELALRIHSKTIQNYFRRFRELRGKIPEGLHISPCKILGVCSSGDGTGFSKMGEVFHLQIEKTFAPIIRSACYARRYAKAFGMRTESATSAPTKGFARVTRCHVQLVKNGNGILLSAQSVNVKKRESGNTSAAFSTSCIASLFSFITRTFTFASVPG